MKTTLVKRLFKIGTTVCAAVLLALLSSCEKETIFAPDLALNNNAIVLPQEEGQTRILVQARDAWNAESLADWITLSSTSGTTSDGRGEFIVYITDNTNKIPRKGEIKLNANGKTTLLAIKQEGFKSKIEFVNNKASLRAIPNTARMKLDCNMDYSTVKMEYTWVTEGTTDWIKDAEFNPQTGYFTYSVENNTLDTARVAIITLSMIDPIDRVLTTTLEVTQNKGSDANLATEVPFDYARQFTGTTITENRYIVGVVISENGNQNMGTNFENRSTSVPSINYDENQCTVYIQSEDGSKGYRLRTISGSNNQFQLGEKVWVWLKGATVTKEAGYTLSGITTEHMINSLNEVDYRVCQERHIRELTDDDVYTYRKVKNLEVALPEGCWSNINDGYIGRVDVYPTRLRDDQGDQICILINGKVEWRRIIMVTNTYYNYTFDDESQVRLPKGSGDMKGIIVNETAPHVATRYGNSVGHYSIRPLNRDEIKIAPEEGSGFSKVIAKWTKFPTDNIPNEATPYLPSETEYETYQGKLCHSYVDKGWSAKYDNGSTNVTGVTGSNDFTGVDGSHYPIGHPLKTTEKGWIPNGTWKLGNGLWWVNGKPTWWYVEFSTMGINSLISFNFSIFSPATGSGPRNFAAEYSLDNSNWTKLGDFTSEDFVDWTATPPNQTVMPKVLSYNLPSNAQNKTKVYVRLIVRNTNDLTNNKGETVAYSAKSASSFYLGDIYVKCNK